MGVCNSFDHLCRIIFESEVRKTENRYIRITNNFMNNHRWKKLHI